MRVRMLTLSAGPAGVRQIGQVVEVTDEEGNALIAARSASLVEASTPVTADEPPADEPAAAEPAADDADEDFTAEFLEGKTVAELHEIAAQRNVQIGSRATKAEIIEALLDA